MAGRNGKPPGLDGIKRIGFNINAPSNDAAGPFIDRTQLAPAYPYPFNGFADGVHFWSSGVLNSLGLAANTTQSWGGGGRLPAVANYAGPYCFDGVDTGTGSTIVVPTTNWTVTAGVTCAHLDSNGKVDGTTVTCPNTGASYNSGGQFITTGNNPGYWCLGMTMTSGGGTGSVQVNVTVADAGFVNFVYYDSADSVDRAAGKIFRRGYLNVIAKLRPGWVRFLNWGGGGSVDTRWDWRVQPFANGTFNTSCISPPYGALSGTDAFTLPSVSLSGCARFATPGAMTHGEYAFAYAPNSVTSIGSGNPANCAISSITPGNPTTINTGGACIAVGQTGLSVKLYMQPGNSGVNPINATGALANLHLFPVTATFVSSTQFTVNFNSTGGTWGGSCDAACIVGVNETLNVGGRGVFPLTMWDGYTSINFEPTSIKPTSGNYYLFMFDKKSIAQTDGAGNPVQGVWIATTGAPAGSLTAPPELMVEFINELNALYTSGPPTNLWIVVPHHATIPGDPDYSAGADWPQNMYSAIFTGANGFPGLCKQCGLFVELSNETWNFSFNSPTFYYMRQGWLRWGTADSGGDISGFHTLRSILVVNDIKNSPIYPLYAGRTRFVMAGQGAIGPLPPNIIRIYGTNGGLNPVVNTDSANPLNTNTTFTGTISGTSLTIQNGTLSGPIDVGYVVGYVNSGPCVVTAGSGLNWTVTGQWTALFGGTIGACNAVSGVAMTAAKAPMTLFDKFAGAPYIDGNYNTGSNSFVQIAIQGGADWTNFGQNSVQVLADLRAMADVTYGNPPGCAGANYTAQSYCWPFVQAAGATIIGQWGSNKEWISYEGGLDNDPFDSNITAQANSINFMNLFYQSADWAHVQMDFFAQSRTAPNQAMPTMFLEICNSGAGINWHWSSMGCPDFYGSTTVEGGGLSVLGKMMGDYNALQGN